jgi:hypothetical protein
MTSPPTTDRGRVELPVGNYYGAPYVEKRGDGYFLVLDDWGDESYAPISADFYAACVKEFGDARE